MQSSNAVPDNLPVMILDDSCLFPGVTIPLYIFEERYRKMLSEVATGKSMFILATRDNRHLHAEEAPPRPIATVGIIRANQDNPDGTHHILLEGLERVQLFQPEQRDDGLWMANLKVLHSKQEPPDEEAGKIMDRLINDIRRFLDAESLDATQLIEQLEQIMSPGLILDFLGFTFLQDLEEKLSFLADISFTGRVERLKKQLKSLQHDRLVKNMVSKKSFLGKNQDQN